MADLPAGYKDIPEEERKKAQVFFDRGKTVAGTGNYEYAIEMYLQGLAIDPEAVEAHQAMREISLKRKASGGKPIGMFEGMKLKRPTRDDKQNMLNSEKLLAYDPGNTDHMVSMLQNAHRAGCYDTVLWIGPILQKANADSRSPEINKFITLRDIYKDLKHWKLATDACHYALMLRPDDMDLQTEVKNLGAQDTMSKGKYGQARSFRDSMRDASKQHKLLEAEKDVRSSDSLIRAVQDAEAEWKAAPEDQGKLTKYIEALEKTEQPEYENAAIDVLQQYYEKTRQFRYREKIGRIYIRQWARHDRGKVAALKTDPGNEKLRQEYAKFKQEQLQFELEEFKLWAENYPTVMGLRYEMGVRLFQLQRYNEAIPVLQQARQDPKHRHDAGLLLGRCFLAQGYKDEAAQTLQDVINDYQLRGDQKSKDIFYWRARALEELGQKKDALKHYSQVAQWDFNYRDVQNRIKGLRTAP